MFYRSEPPTMAMQTATDQALANMERAIKTPATKIVYLHRLKEYLQFMGVDIYSKLATKKAKDTEDSIVSYVDHLTNKGLTPQTIRVCINAIKLFYVSNRVSLNWEWIRSMLPSVDKVTEDRLYSKQELKAILDKCDERKRAMVLLLYSSGIRIGGMESLKVGHLEKLEKYGIYKIQVYAGTTSKYVTFTTPEATQAIDFYLELRRKRGEKVDENSPLFRKAFDKGKANHEIIRKAGKKLKIKPQPMKLGSIISLLDDLLQDSGVRTVDKNQRQRKKTMRFHAWRKACNSAMIKAGVSYYAKERCLGHTTGLDNSYGRLTEEDLLIEYVKAIPLLTISEAPQLKEQVDRLTVQVADSDELRRRLSKTEEDLAYALRVLQSQTKQNSRPPMSAEEQKKYEEWLAMERERDQAGTG
jgi:integrase